MGFFNRKDKIVDLTEDYHYDRKKSKADIKDNLFQPEQTSSVQNTESSFGGFFNSFGSSPSSTNSSSFSNSSISTANSTENSYGNSNYSSTESLDAEEKRRRLAIRLKNMTDRIEDLSNQIYQLQQKMEVIEKKINLGRYE